MDNTTDHKAAKGDMDHRFRDIDALFVIANQPFLRFYRVIHTMVRSANHRLGKILNLSSPQKAVERFSINEEHMLPIVQMSRFITGDQVILNERQLMAL